MQFLSFFREHKPASAKGKNATHTLRVSVDLTRPPSVEGAADPRETVVFSAHPTPLALEAFLARHKGDLLAGRRHSRLADIQRTVDGLIRQMHAVPAAAQELARRRAELRKITDDNLTSPTKIPDEVRRIRATLEEVDADIRTAHEAISGRIVELVKGAGPDCRAWIEEAISCAKSDLSMAEDAAIKTETALGINRALDHATMIARGILDLLGERLRDLGDEARPNDILPQLETPLFSRR